MKKSIFGGISMLFLVSILATGCANEKVESRGDKSITFSSVVGKQTRASEFTYWAEGAGPTVWAYPTGSTSLFHTFALEYEGPLHSDWTYGAPIPQPGFSLTYYSYYPTNGVSDPIYDGTEVSFDYTVCDKDLIAAMTEDGDADVTLQFHHLLSQINFAIQGMTGVKYEVSNIKITGVASSGTYTFGTGGAIGTWSPSSGTGTYSYTPATATTTGADNKILYLGNTGDIPSGANNANTNALMLMPQTLTASSTLTFDYNASAMTGGPLESGVNITVDLSTLTTKTWLPGHRYLYVIDLTGEFITFTIEVDPWVDGGDPIPVEPFKTVTP